MGHHHHHHCKPMCEPVCEPMCKPVCEPGIFAPGGVGFWVFLLILAILGLAWAESGPVVGPGC